MQYLFNYGLKGGGLALLGIGVFGCVLMPFDAIPHDLWFLRESSPKVIWGVLIGLIVVGGAMAYFGWKSEKAKEEEQKAGQ
jgi:hypothetical protein